MSHIGWDTRGSRYSGYDRIMDERRFEQRAHQGSESKGWHDHCDVTRPVHKGKPLQSGVRVQVRERDTGRCFMRRVYQVDWAAVSQWRFPR